MKLQDARALATRHREGLFRLLEAAFDDPATALKFARYTLQRLEWSAEDLEEGTESPSGLYRVAKDTCSDYLSSAAYRKTAFVAGDAGLPLDIRGSAPGEPLESTVCSLPRMVRLVLRLIVIDRLSVHQTAALLEATPDHVVAVLDRVQAALGGTKLKDLTSALDAGLPPVPEFEVVIGAPVAASACDAPSPSPAAPSTGRKTRSSPVPVPGRNTPSRGTRRISVPCPVPGSTEGTDGWVEGSNQRTAVGMAILGALLIVAWLPLYAAYERPTSPLSPPQVPSPSSSAARRPIGKLFFPAGPAGELHPAQNIGAPASGEAHAILDSGVQIWLSATSRGNVDVSRFELFDGIARIVVDDRAAGFLAIAQPLSFTLRPGTYVLRKGEKTAVGLATIEGLALAKGEAAAGMKIERNRMLALSRDGSPEVRDLSTSPDETWGQESRRIAAAAERRETAPSDDQSTRTGTDSGSTEPRQLPSSEGAGQGSSRGSWAPAAGAQGYRRAF